MDLNAPQHPSPQDALSMTDEALAGLADGGLEAEIFVRGGPELSLVYDPALGRGVESLGGEVRATCRVWRDGRCGVSVGDVHGAEDLARLVTTARARAPDGRVTPIPATGARLLGPPSEGAISGQRALENARALTGPLLDRGGCFQAVLLKQSATWTVVASTRGTRAVDHHPVEQALLRYETLRGAVVDGVAGPLQPGLLDPVPVIARLSAAIEAVAAEGGAPEPGLPWVLRPVAAGPLVAGMGWLLRGSVVEKSSGLLRAVGRKIFPSALSLVDEAPRAGFGARRVDDEGQAVTPVSLVDQGRLVGFLHSTASAAALQASGGGRGLRTLGQGEPEPTALALRVLPGTSAIPSDRNELVARLENFTTIPRPARVSMIIAGWVIRGEERVRRIAPFEVDLPLLDTLRRLQGVAADPAFLLALDGCSTPSLIFPPLV